MKLEAKHEVFLKRKIQEGKNMPLFEYSGPENKTRLSRLIKEITKSCSARLIGRQALIILSWR